MPRELAALAKTGTGDGSDGDDPFAPPAQLQGRPPCVLVIAPTRELARQVASEFESIASGVDATSSSEAAAAVVPSNHHPLVTLCVYGGTDVGGNCSSLRAGVDFVVGTPGRLLDLSERGALVRASKTERSRSCATHARDLPIAAHALYDRDEQRVPSPRTWVLECGRGSRAWRW